jgi:transcriptional regulator with XRE-family HTH domain
MNQETNEKINPMKELRESLGLTQQEFAKKADISKSLVMKIESGEQEITGKTKNLVRDSFNLNNDWFQEIDYNKKVDISAAEENIIEYIKKSINYERGARAIYFILKEVFDTTGLTEEERKTYIQYMFQIIMNLRSISKDAKSFIRKELFIPTNDNAQKIVNDIMNLYGDDINKNIEFPGIVEVNITDEDEQKFDFS